MTVLLPERWLQPLQLVQGHGIRLVRGEGGHVWDEDDREYLDFDTNGGVNVLGHAHPAVTAAITEQIQRVTSSQAGFDDDTREEFIEAVSLVVPEPLSHISFANSGSEAVEEALKFARGATGRSRFVAMQGAFHGMTFGAMAVGGDPRVHKSFAPMLGEVTHVPFNDVDALLAALDKRVAAVILEPIQWDAGARVPAPEYLAEVANVCRKNGSLLIFDEVQTALRSWPPLVGTAAGVVPDLICFGPSIANGFPMGATAIARDVARRIPRESPVSTVAGNPLACAAGAATLRTIAEPNLRARLAAIGDYLLSRLKALRISDIKEVRGHGLLIAIELHGSAHPVVDGLRRRGVLVTSGASGVVRMLPPVILERRQVDIVVESLAAAVLDARHARRNRSRERQAEDVTLRGFPTRRASKSRPA